MIGENGHHNLNGTNGVGSPYSPGLKGFPSLPIVAPDPPRLGQSEKYGALFYFGITGLIIIISMVGAFSLGVWRLREVWANVYALSDPSRPEDQRIQAAYALSRDPRANTEQRRDLVFRKDLPELARYLIAESIGADIVVEDPRGFSNVVARSEGWPPWLRLLLTRTLALASADGASLPLEPLEELRNNRDRMTGLWAAFAEAVSDRRVAGASETISEAASSADPEQELAALLQKAVKADEDDQRGLLHQATVWMRTHHPEAARIWKGWEVRDGRLVRTN